MRLASWSCLFPLLLSCGFDSHPPADAGVDVRELPCVDDDRDGYGEGEGCRGPDCHEGDATSHECACDDLGVGAGCPCGQAVQPVVCYDGPPGTGGVGNCRGGLRRCEGGHWTECLGQVQPLPEECNYEDDDCDGAADDGVLSECGNCNFGCTLLRWGASGEPFPLEGRAAPVALADGSITVGGDEESAVTIILLQGENDACPTVWGPLDASADIPLPSSVFFEMRAGSTIEDLAAREWSPVLHMPFADPPAELEYDEWRPRFLEIRVTLFSRDDRVPVLRWMTLQSSPDSCGFG